MRVHYLLYIHVQACFHSEMFWDQSCIVLNQHSCHCRGRTASSCAKSTCTTLTALNRKSHTTSRTSAPTTCVRCSCKCTICTSHHVAHLLRRRRHRPDWRSAKWTAVVRTPTPDAVRARRARRHTTCPTTRSSVRCLHVQF